MLSIALFNEGALPDEYDQEADSYSPIADLEADVKKKLSTCFATYCFFSQTSTGIKTIYSKLWY